MSPPYDAAVIGSGPNGLAAAIRLAETGRSVVVYEAGRPSAAAPGPANSRCRDSDTMSAPPSTRWPSVRACSPAWDSRSTAWNGSILRPVARILSRPPAAMLFRDVEQTASTLAGDGALARMVRPFLSRWDDLARDALGTPGLPASPILIRPIRCWPCSPRPCSPAPGSGGPRPCPVRGDGCTLDPALERPLSSAIGLMLAIAGHVGGWPLPRGGSQSIADALGRKFEGLGGTIRCGVRVRHLDEVETRGPVLFDTSPRELVRIAGEHIPEAFAARLLRFRHGAGVFKLDWALSGPIPWKDPTIAQAATVHLGGPIESIETSERAPYQEQHPERPYVLRPAVAVRSHGHRTATTGRTAMFRPGRPAT